MNSWNEDDLRAIAESNDLYISPFREDGTTYSTPDPGVAGAARLSFLLSSCVRLRAASSALISHTQTVGRRAATTRRHQRSRVNRVDLSTDVKAKGDRWQPRGAAARRRSARHHRPTTRLARAARRQPSNAEQLLASCVACRRRPTMFRSHRSGTPVPATTRVAICPDRRNGVRAQRREPQQLVRRQRLFQRDASDVSDHASSPYASW